VLPDMTIGPPDNPRDFEQVAVFGVVVAITKGNLSTAERLNEVK